MLINVFYGFDSKHTQKKYEKNKCTHLMGEKGCDMIVFLNMFVVCMRLISDVLKQQK